MRCCDVRAWVGLRGDGRAAWRLADPLLFGLGDWWCLLVVGLALLSAPFSHILMEVTALGVGVGTGRT